MLKLDHVVFPVWDAEASLDFYRDVMGFTLINAFSGKDWGGYHWLMMIFAPGDGGGGGVVLAWILLFAARGGGGEIVLVALSGAKRPPHDGLAKDVRHLAFAESSLKSLDRWRRRLKAKGVAFWEEDHGSQRSLYFEDPNGMVLEITAPPSRAKGPASGAALAAARKWIKQ